METNDDFHCPTARRERPIGFPGRGRHRLAGCRRIHGSRWRHAGRPNHHLRSRAGGRRQSRRRRRSGRRLRAAWRPDAHHRQLRMHLGSVQDHSLARRTPDDCARRDAGIQRKAQVACDGAAGRPAACEGAGALDGLLDAGPAGAAQAQHGRRSRDGRPPDHGLAFTRFLRNPVLVHVGHDLRFSTLAQRCRVPALPASLRAGVLAHRDARRRQADGVQPVRLAGAAAAGLAGRAGRALRHELPGDCARPHRPGRSAHGHRHSRAARRSGIAHRGRRGRSGVSPERLDDGFVQPGLDDRGAAGALQDRGRRLDALGAPSDGPASAIRRPSTAASRSRAGRPSP